MNVACKLTSFTSACLVKIKHVHNIASSSHPMDIGAGVYIHPTVRTAIAALQAGDKLAWLTCFTAGAKLFDSGKRKSIFNFTRDNIGLMHFTDIERVDNDGRDVYGMLRLRDEETIHAYFKFRLDAAAMCSRLDIGPVDGDQPLSLLPYSLYLALLPDPGETLT